MIDTGSQHASSPRSTPAPRPACSDRDDDDDRSRQTSRRSRYTGAATFAVTLSPDGKTLYAVNAGANSIAVIPLHGEDAYRVRGLIPTAYEPHDITFSADGRWMYIVNGKSVTGPEPGPPGQQHGRDHEHHAIRAATRRPPRGARVEPVSVPARARVAGQRAGADVGRARAADAAGRRRTTSTPATTANDAQR